MLRKIKCFLALLLALTLCAALFPAALAEEAGTIAPAEEPEEEIGAIAPVGDEPEATYSGKCGKSLNWSLNTGTGVLTITGSGTTYDWNWDSYAPWYDYRDSITSVKLPDALTRIGNYAFYNLSKLTSVTLPDSLTRIGERAFGSCTKLKSIKIPESVTEIEQYAFNGCYALTSVTLPPGLTQIPAYCFSNCKSLPGLTIPDGVESIGQQAFAYCRGMTAVEIPSNVAYVGEYAFYGCDSLTAVAVPNYGTNIAPGKTTLGDPDVTTIYGHEDSQAESYANEYNYVFKPYEQFNPFVDVPSGKYYHDAVVWAYHHVPRITSGTDATHFSPNATITRGQAVTFLWNFMSQMKPKGTNNPFVDVASGKYYYTAVLWAYYFSPQITSGTDKNHFSPNKLCTREQVVTFLWNLYDQPEPGSSYNPFKDVSSGKYYYKAVLWAYYEGITTGVDKTHFGVGTPCTRAQFVTFLYTA